MLQILNGNKIYSGKTQTYALKNINITLPNKGLIVINGKSGSGKTTLLNCIAGIDKLTSGKINGIKKENCGIIFQDFALIENLTIYDNLKIAYDISNKYLSIEQALLNVNLNIDTKKKINELSGGEKQRVAIARTLLLNCKVILADEATGNLDLDNSNIIVNVLKNISKDKLVIVVTHNTLFDNYADRVITLDEGKIIKDTIINENQYDLDGSFKEETKKKKLRFKSIFKLSFSVKSSFSRIILGIIILLFSMFSIMLTLNIITTSKNDMIINSMSEYNINTINFLRKNNDSFISLNDEEVNGISSKYKNSYISYTSNYNCEIDRNNITINRIYKTNEVKETLLYGGNKLSDNSVVISYSLAKTIGNYYGKNNFEDVIGLSFKINGINVLISGITTKVKAIPNRENSESLKPQYEIDTYYVYMNSNTFEKFLYGNINEYLTINTKYIMNNQIYNSSKLEGIEIGNNEIILDESKYKYYFGDDKTMDDLLNKELDFEFVYDNSIVKTYTLKIVGFSTKSIVNNETYNKLFEYSNEYFDLTRTKGIAFLKNDISTTLLKQLNKDGLYANYFLTENIDLAYSVSNFIGLSLLIVIIPLTIILVIYLISYSKQSIIFKKREIGILKSLGFSNLEISKILFLNILILIILSFTLSLITIPIGITLINNILISNGVMFTPIVNNIIYILLLILVVIVIVLISLTINILMLNKKSDVDLVYER